MKKLKIRYFTIIIVTIIGILILLYVLNDYKKKSDITYKSVTGQLENGKQYKYYGTDNNQFDLEQFIKENRLRLYDEEDGYGTIYTFEKMVEISDRKYYENEKSVSSTTILFDKKSDSWVVTENYNPDYRFGWGAVGYPTIIVIRRADGRIKYYTTEPEIMTLENGDKAIVLPSGRMYLYRLYEANNEEFDWELFREKYQLSYYEEYEEMACMSYFEAASAVDDYIEEHNMSSETLEGNGFIKVYRDKNTKNYIVMETFAPDYDFEESSNRHVWIIPYNTDDWDKNVVVKVYSDKPFD